MSRLAILPLIELNLVGIFPNHVDLIVLVPKNHERELHKAEQIIIRLSPRLNLVSNGAFDEEVELVVPLGSLFFLGFGCSEEKGLNSAFPKAFGLLCLDFLHLAAVIEPTSEMMDSDVHVFMV